VSLGVKPEMSLTDLDNPIKGGSIVELDDLPQGKRAFLHYIPKNTETAKPPSPLLVIL